MKKLIAPFLTLVLLSITTYSYATKTVLGKARIGNNKITCPDNTTTCYILHDNGTAEVQLNGDWYYGTWSPMITSNPSGTPVNYQDLPEVMNGSDYNIDVECPTCPPEEPEE